MFSAWSGNCIVFQVDIVKENKSNAHANSDGRDSPALSDALLPSVSSTSTEPSCPISM